jgi:uncharacterized protein (TIGR03085 family)
MAWTTTERAALVATLRDTDPDTDSLCEGWTTRHLLAHLVEREHAPLRSAIDMITTKKPGQERFMSRLVEQAWSSAGYQALVTRFADGPPSWSLIGWMGDAANLVEYVVHHEDVRRAGPRPAEPRTLPADEVAAIWKRSGTLAKHAYRRSPVGVVLATPDGERRGARTGPETVTVTGDPVELVLHALGRDSVAHVEVTGPADAVDRFTVWAAGSRRG